MPTRNLPTARDYLSDGPEMWLLCRACQHQAWANYQQIVDRGQGDVPLIELRFRCRECESTDMAFTLHGRAYRSTSV